MDFAEDALEAALAPIRVPFSDEVIEKMAKAAQPIVYEGTEWRIIHDSAKTALKKGIRAALAAGGLEPCAVPDYAPQDVAFSGERASDEELEHVYEQGREFGELVNLEGIRAVRSRVEAPLLAEIARLEQEAKANIECQETMVLDLRNKDAALKAVTAERDEMCHQQTKRCMSWRRCFNLAFRLKNKYRAELAALRQPVGATPTEAEVEELARAMRDAYDDKFRQPRRKNVPSPCFLAIARAAYAHIGRKPVYECKECIQWRNANNELVRRATQPAPRWRASDEPT